MTAVAPSTSSPPSAAPSVTPPSGAAPRWLTGIFLANLVAQTAIILTGGLVRVTGSGLGCPTWPQCTEGSLVPTATQTEAWHKYVEFGNRTLTGVLGLLAIAAIVGAIVWRRRSGVRRRPILWLSVIPLAGTVAQAVLGGITVLTGLNPVTVALHFLLSGLGLLFFGPEGSRTSPLASGTLTLGDGFTVSGQVILMVSSAIVLSGLFFLVFERTVMGKALRATAVNRVGARLVGIRPARTALLAYGCASLLAGLIGVLIAPVTTMYYDSGFIIGLKAFVAAIIGGLVSYPMTAIGALAVGVVESFASFWSGALKDVIVFSLLIPVLMLRSFMARHVEEEEEEVDQ